MMSINGFGTTIYGKRDLHEVDGSYIVTKWIIILFFPLIPLGSFRVIKAKQSFLAGHPKYQMTEVGLNKKQVLYTYLVWWSIPVIILLLALVGSILPH